MKKVLNIVFVSLLLSSCSFNTNEIIILKTLDQFDSQKENEQLGFDLLNYKFKKFLPIESPDLSQEIFKNISWKYFVKASNNEVSFRLTLNNESIKHKKRIVEYFEKTVNQQVDKQVYEKQKFSNAIEQTLEHFSELDNNYNDSFWENTSAIFRNKTTKQDFFDAIKSRDGAFVNRGERVLLYKQYYESLPETSQTGFYVVCFTFIEDKTIFEQLTYHDENGILKITGYEYGKRK